MSHDSNPTFSILMELFKQSNIIDRKLSSILSEIGLTTQQFLLLMQIDELVEENGQATSQELIEHLGIARAGVSRLSMRSEEAGLIKRNLDYGKTTYLNLTSKGEKLMEESIEEFLERIKLQSKKIKLNELESILIALKKLDHLI